MTLWCWNALDESILVMRVSWNTEVSEQIWQLQLMEPMPGMCLTAKPCELAWHREGPDKSAVMRCGRWQTFRFLDAIYVWTMVQSASISFIYIDYFSNMSFFKWSWYSLTAVVWKNVSTVDLAKEHSWTDVFSESIGFANSWVFQWMSEAQVSHSVAARSMWRLEWPRSWLLVFWFGETTIQLVETSGYFTTMLVTSNIIQ